jgi:hypothetical protein
MIGAIATTIPITGTTAIMTMVGGMKAGTNIAIVATSTTIGVAPITMAIGVIATTTGVVDTATAIGAMTGGYADGNIDDRGAKTLSAR